MDYRIAKLLEAANAKIWAPDILVAISDMKVVWAGDKLQQEIGHKTEDLVGMRLNEFVLLDAAAVNRIMTSMMSGEHTSIVTAVKNDGKTVQLKIRLEIIRYEQNQYFLGKIL